MIKQFGTLILCYVGVKRLTNKVTKREMFKEITGELYDLYCEKNDRYGDSFSAMYEEFGMISSCIRFSDKVNRLKTLVKKDLDELDESKIDTIRDLVNYGIMTLIEERLKEND